MKQISTSITVTSDGLAVSQPAVVTSVSVVGGATGPVVYFKDGGPTGPIRLALEPGNTTSISEVFPGNSAIRFDTGVYVETQSGDVTAVSIGFINPRANQVNPS